MNSTDTLHVLRKLRLFFYMDVHIYDSEICESGCMEYGRIETGYKY